MTSPWTNATSYLALLHGEQNHLTDGSGFFWRSASGRIFLVSNWHVFSGYTPDGHSLRKDGARPDRVIMFVYKQLNKPEKEGGDYDMQYTALSVQLCEPDYSKPTWLEHPELGRKIDVAALDVTDVVAGYHVFAANEIEADVVMEPTVSQDVFIVGFPFGQITGAPAPIWKRGSIALDPFFNPDGLPKTFVDTATRPGMSGSVVLARHHVTAGRLTKKDGSQTELVFGAKFDLVMGVYSGRIGPDLEKAQLGIIWKRSVISDLVDKGVAATA